MNDASYQDLRRFLDIFTKTQLFEVFINKKLTLGNKFGMCFDEAIREEYSISNINLRNINCSPKLTIKQISNTFCIIKLILFLL